MLKNKIKLIVSDLDDTLATSGFKISNTTLSTILKLQKKYNNIFTIATGRLDSMAREYIEKMEIILPIISCNGALIRDPISWNIISKTSIDNEICKKIIAEIRTNKIDVVIYTPEIIHGEKNSKRIASIKRYNNLKNHSRHLIKYEIVNNIVECINSEMEILKILVSMESEWDKKIIFKIVSKYQEVSISNSQSHIIDIVSTKINKGIAIKYICNSLKTKMENVLVYGDNYNDYEMIKIAGHSVAVANAVDDIKKLANEITESAVDGGVANHIQKNFLKI